jgi:hypothetical protein
MSYQVLKIDKNSDTRFLRFSDGDARVCNSFGLDFSPINLCLMPYMVSETWDFSHNLLF